MFSEIVFDINFISISRIVCSLFLLYIIQQIIVINLYKKIRNYFVPIIVDIKAPENIITNVKVTQINQNVINNFKKTFASSGIKIFYGSQSGKTKKFAEELYYKIKKVRNEILKIPINNSNELVIVDLNDYEPELILEEKSLCIIVISTYVDGESPDNAKWFCEWLNQAPDDFRIDRHVLRNVTFTIFGCGNSLYTGNFNKVGQTMHQNLATLGAKPLMPFFPGDEYRDLKDDFSKWNESLIDIICNQSEAEVTIPQSKINDVLTYSVIYNAKSHSSKGENNKKFFKINYKSSVSHVNHQKIDTLNGKTMSCKSPINISSQKEFLTDLEDMGSMLEKIQKSSSKTDVNSTLKINSSKAELDKNLSNPYAEMKPMLTPEAKSRLTKQGYRIVGTHSGVKLCRWTKSALRGRGGCYKHSFYGIDSSRCVESTPSLACANKCVFCWRHHSNPVGTEWKWQMDEPDFIFNEIIAQHKSMIKQFKGVPGVIPERLNLALTPRHCALSLVGEPIMYPKINNYVQLLHRAGISTFLVTNAQFPDQIINLDPVTQLYVSIDAHDRESLKKIDRPLHKDFWERFIASLKAVSDFKGLTRTVYRMTLVKKWNFNAKDYLIDLTDLDSNNAIKDKEKYVLEDYVNRFEEDIRNYIDLIALGRPDFIEIKGVTFCGTSGNELTMKDVPWHTDVLNFGLTLIQALNHPINNKNSIPRYELACEHEHSNCVLLADNRFKIDESWHTWIDYDKFITMVSQYYDTIAISEPENLQGVNLDNAKKIPQNYTITPLEKARVNIDNTISNKLKKMKSLINSLEYSCPTPWWSQMGAEERGFDPGENRITGQKRSQTRLDKSIKE
ncbi:unnamed protein product [Gordionus sp. m RMFG-2023]|uniref:S-adenosyl-L-methionine-dependent tRNA 4-demethylwyosine synthase TYW1-like n=1 Tax=Gordionus sp. m RMFG-2023 TaxID=3053472 RepID=UPI0030E5EB1B